MTNLIEQEPVRPLDGVEMVAAALLAISSDASSRVLKHFDQEELRRLALVASRLGAIPAPVIGEIHELFAEEISGGKLELVGDAVHAEALLARALPEEQVADIMSDVRGGSNAFFWRRLATLPHKTIADYLAQERPQTIAVVIGKLESAAAAQALAELPAATRAQTMRRLLTAKPVSEVVLRIVEGSLRDDLFSGAGAPSSSDASVRVAGIINQLEAEQVNEILYGLDESEPVLAAQLRTLVFSFEDITKLGQRARMIVFDQASTERVILALRGADALLRDAVLPCLSARTRRMVEAELASAVTPPRRDILGAQREIANLVLRLADQGLIDLAGEGQSTE
ncbi:MAG: flagellar motor switch protein FliG [Methylocystis sp.]|nr:MAG: flagellar motor switch protein FliG [Methylocystis sp.]